MDNLSLALILVTLLAGFGFLYWRLNEQFSAKSQRDDEDLEEIVNKIFGKSANKVAEQSKQILKSEKDAISENLDNKQKIMEKMVSELRKELNEQQKELHDIERDRNKEFARLKTEIEKHREVTDELKVSAKHLAKVLSNNQKRGAWGERIIEDLLRSNSFIEGTHYSKQSSLGETTLRPDIMLLLPEERVVAVDVKFPYSEVQKMATAENKKAKLDHMKQFRRDLKEKIKQVQKYILPEENTLDYAILFVPNEAVYSYINQQMSEVVDDALQKRVIMVSPFTFVIVARTVMEAHRNFQISGRLREVVGYIEEFVKDWERFKDEFEKYGRSIDRLKKDYDQITGTRVNQMEMRIDRIETYRQGNLLEDPKK